MPSLLIIWHSRTGGSAALARAAFSGARSEPAVLSRMIAADRVLPDDLLAASAFIFVGPENLAALSGPMKDMFDRCYYPCLGQLNGRAYASIICAGSDGAGAQRQLDRIATGWRMRRATDPMTVITHAQDAHAIMAPKSIDADDLAKAAATGALLAAGLVIGLY